MTCPTNQRDKHALPHMHHFFYKTLRLVLVCLESPSRQPLVVCLVKGYLYSWLGSYFERRAFTEHHVGYPVNESLSACKACLCLCVCGCVCVCVSVCVCVCVCVHVQ